MDVTQLFLFEAQGVLLMTEGADFFRSIGKIYVVVAVLVAIFIGISLYLLYIDRRVTKLEKNN